jgi:hypothetical protein
MKFSGGGIQYLEGANIEEVLMSHAAGPLKPDSI